MELKDVYELWDRFDSSNATFMELELKGDHLKLVKGSEEDLVNNVACVSKRGAVALPKSHSLADTVQVLKDTEGSKEEGSKEESSKEENFAGKTVVKAPLVGTFYASPSPDEEPFVTVGKMVKKGDVVGIIEAMKLMNEVVAPVDGKISKIEAKDGCMVQYDQTILIIE